MKNVVIAILAIFVAALLLLCEGWNKAYTELANKNAELRKPVHSPRIDIVVTTEGNLHVLVDARWYYQFEGACKGLRAQNPTF